MDYVFDCIQMVLGHILALGLSGGTAILGGWILKDFILKRKLCTKETEAEVTGYKKETSNEDDGNRVSYYPKYKYYIGGTLFENISNIGESSPIFTIGSKTTLRYNPQNHYQHYIVGSSFSMTMVIGGIFFILMGGTYFIFICMGIWNRIFLFCN